MAGNLPKDITVCATEWASNQTKEYEGRGLLEDREDERPDCRRPDEDSDRNEKHYDHEREQKVFLVSANEHPKVHEKAPISSLRQPLGHSLRPSEIRNRIHHLPF